jgi:hypothetical protein
VLRNFGDCFFFKDILVLTLLYTILACDAIYCDAKTIDVQKDMNIHSHVTQTNYWYMFERREVAITRSQIRIFLYNMEMIFFRASVIQFLFRD